ncbi:MAG: SRPBCC family protein [Paracoccaceae bacterium]
MDQRSESEANRTVTERKSERELVVTRTFDGPARLIFAAWTTPALLMRWWAPKSTGATLVSCEADVRAGGRYRFEFAHPSAPQTMTFFGKYLEVIPNARIVWTNEESAAGAVSTLTFEERGGKTLLALQEVYPSKEVLDEAIQGMEGGVCEQYDQLDVLLVTLAAEQSRD